MAATGQTINDRLNAVRYALAGQGLARTVCKATTEEVIGPKKKHIDYLLACTDEPNVSIPQLANLLIDRSQHTAWTVVFKSLITIHHLLDYGNERFTQYLATSNHSFELNDFMDRTTPQGYGMSTFVRRYAKYINNKVSSYKALAIDLCKVKPGKDNALRTMNMDNLCKTLPVVHDQFDSLLDFGVEVKDLNNGIIMAAFRLLYKDLNRIFVAYQEAIINLVERYFKLSRKKTREALNMYKKYLDRMGKVANFFKIVEQVGLDKNEMPDTSKLTSLLTVLEDHMAQLEAKKRGANVTSPDADDDGDEGHTSPAKSADQEVEVKVEPSRQASPTNEGKEKQKADEAQASTSSTSSAPAKKAPPPARPSPVSRTTPQPDSKPPASSSKPEGDKKAPPERPAKPPSRPPPPSAAAPAPPPASAAAQQQQPATNVSQPVQDSAREISEGNEPTPANTEISAEPPNVPSPTSPSPAQEAVETPEDKPDETAAPSDKPQANGSTSVTTESGVNLDQGSGGTEARRVETGDDDQVGETGNLPACASSINETSGGAETHEELVNGELQGEPPAETNHVSSNNVNNHDHEQDRVDANDEVQPPSPPPPIE